MRTLRISGSPAVPVSQVSLNPVSSERYLRIDEDDTLRDKVDHLYVLEQTFSQKKKELDGMDSSIKELKKELREYARSTGKKKIFGKNSVAEFKPSISRGINGKEFLEFLKSLGKAQDFWSYAKIGIGAATKDYGEAVLESFGILTSEVDPFGNMKVRSHTN
jgi:hypothetical protein